MTALERVDAPRGPVAGLSGLTLAAITAAVSGVAVFVNSYGVHAVVPPSAYTAGKNMVAAALLAAGMLVGRRHHGGPLGRFALGGARLPRMPLRTGQWVALAYVGFIGGGLAFVLFFEGLARTSAAPAAFWRDTLVVWVALLAGASLRERLRWWNLGAVALLVVGQMAMNGGPASLVADRGELMVLASSLLWAGEVVVAKRLLTRLAPATVALVRMGVGALALAIYLGVTGSLGVLGSLDIHQLTWLLATGGLLAAYVGLWMTALSRARAVDVSSVLAASVVLTWSLEVASGTSPTVGALWGVVIVAVGAGLVVLMTRRLDRRDRQVGAGS